MGVLVKASRSVESTAEMQSSEQTDLFGRSMERMSQQATHTVYRSRSGTATRPQLRAGLPQLHTGTDVPAYDDSILERLQQVLLSPMGVESLSDETVRRHCHAGMWATF